MKKPNLSWLTMMMLKNPHFKPPKVVQDATGATVNARTCLLPGCGVRHTQKGGYCCRQHCAEHDAQFRAARKLEADLLAGRLKGPDGKLYILHDGRALAGHPEDAKALALFRTEQEVRDSARELAAVFTIAIWYEHDLVEDTVLYSKPRPDLNPTEVTK